MSPPRSVVAAMSGGRHDGFSVEDIAWLLRNARGDVVVLRPAPTAHARIAPLPGRDPLLRTPSAREAHG